MVSKVAPSDEGSLLFIHEILRRFAPQNDTKDTLDFFRPVILLYRILTAIINDTILFL